MTWLRRGSAFALSSYIVIIGEVWWKSLVEDFGGRVWWKSLVESSYGVE